MQINKPPSPGTPTSSVSGSPAADKATRVDNPLAQLVGQVVTAHVVQSKAVQIAAAQAALLQAGIAARLTTDQRDQKPVGSPPATSTTNTPPGTTAPAGTSSAATANPATSGATPPTQTQYATTLQIGNERVVVLSEQPLPPGAQLVMKVSSPQMIQLLEQPALTAPIATADIADKLLNTMLRQALPLQQPLTRLLATLANDLLLTNHASPAGAAGTVSSPLAATGLNIPPSLAPAVAAALKPLLSQILNTQLTVDNVTDPDMLRTAVTNSGLFREARLVQWAQVLLKQFPDLPARAGTASAANGIPLALSNAASLLQSAAQATPPQGSALTQAAASLLMPQSTTPSATGAAVSNATLQTPASATTAVPAAVANAVAAVLNTDLPDAKQAELLRDGNSIAGNPSAASPRDSGASNVNAAIGANVDAGSTDIDMLRDELLKALSARAQKNQSAFATSTTAASTTSSNVKNAVATETTKTFVNATSTAHNGIPFNAKAAAPSLPLDTSITADTKTTLERLVSAASRQLLSDGSSAATEAVTEEQVLAILRQLPVAQTPGMHTATGKGKPQDDDGQWLLQLLRSSFGALKHLQMQQATNLNAAPSAHQMGNDNPLPPLQIELPILVAQQWHNVNIEIDHRARDNKSESNPKERSWRVTLRFELPQQGVIVAQLNLAGVHVNATLWAEKQATCQQLQQQLMDLSDRLGKAGAHVSTLDVRHGQPPSSKTRIEQRLIDIRT